MKNFFLLIAIFLCFGCADIALRNELKSSRNAFHWSELRIGMKRKEVCQIMAARPDKIETHIVDGKKALVWLYLTNAEFTLDAPDYLMSNYTPLIFIDGRLEGWGFDQYYEILKIPPNKTKPLDYKSEPETRYTNDKEEWPATEHRLVKPPEDEKKSLEKESLEKILKEEEQSQKQPEKKSLPTYPKEDDSNHNNDYFWE